MTLKKELEALARRSKKGGADFEKVCPTREPWKTIFTNEWERYQPRPATRCAQ